MKKISAALRVLLVLIGLFSLTACGEPRKHFWYPIVLKEVNCSTFSGELYLMSHTIGWRNWPYYLDPSDGREIELGTDCTMKVIKRFQKLKVDDESKLNPEQRKYIIRGPLAQ